MITNKKLNIMIVPMKIPNIRMGTSEEKTFVKKAAAVVADVTNIVPTARRKTLKEEVKSHHINTEFARAPVHSILQRAKDILVLHGRLRPRVEQNEHIIAPDSKNDENNHTHQDSQKLVLEDDADDKVASWNAQQNVEYSSSGQNNRADVEPHPQENQHKTQNGKQDICSTNLSNEYSSNR